ncbi:hypothetical protein DDZ13_05305 [Coraliomargarita sinensis]|uniref:Uncharacterized protein n=1 Tax=Coraliomargarita sinensis TaxID=2174842 RepID=A0A317ZK31_9BACT|nr:hypothetical protein DDZ13_05305 [Coraliomargarita sinensis]
MIYFHYSLPFRPQADSFEIGFRRTRPTGIFQPEPVTEKAEEQNKAQDGKHVTMWKIITSEKTKKQAA